MGQKLQSTKLFSICLNEALLRKYGKVPSATFLANQFNLRAIGTTTITSESARKWLNGSAIPEMSRLQVLINWLEINPVDFLGNGKNGDDLIEQNEDDYYFNNLAILLNQLSAVDKKNIFITAWIFRELHASKHEKIDYEKLVFNVGLLKNIR